VLMPPLRSLSATTRRHRKGGFEDEAEAIAVGVRLLARTGDPGLQRAAKSVLSKVTLVVPDPLRDYLTTAPVYVSKSGAPVPAQRDLQRARYGSPIRMATGAAWSG
jgi:hypothetical protein